MIKKSILFVDVAEPGVLGLSYRAGAALFRGAFDVVVECKGVADVYAELSRFKDGEVGHVQVWGHGFPGHPVIALPKGKSPQGVFEQHTLYPPNAAWDACRGGSVWFRSCSVAQGSRGHRFMAAFAAIGINVVAHLGVIGTWAMHSYLMGVRAGTAPWWSVDLAPGDSSPFAPRTVPATQMALPSWTFEHGRGIA
jgi:hypothetical protein